MSPVAQERKCSRQRVREIFEELTDELNEWNLPTITDRVLDRVEADEDLLRLFISEHLREMIYQVGAAYMTALRSQAAALERASAAIKAAVAASRRGGVPLDQILGSAAYMPRTAAFDWLGSPILVEPGRHIRLAIATRRDLAAAREIVEDRMRPPRVTSLWYALMIDALDGADGAPVGQQLTNEQVEDLRLTATHEINRQDAERYAASSDAVDDQPVQLAPDDQPDPADYTHQDAPRRPTPRSRRRR